MVEKAMALALNFVQRGPASMGFLIAGVAFAVGLGVGLRSQLWWGWLMAALGLGYIGLRLYTYL